MLTRTIYASTLAIMLAAPSSALSANFDGTWRIVTRGNPMCIHATSTYNLKIKRGKVSGAIRGRARTGSVSASGDFRLEGNSGSGHRVIITGKLREKSGGGSFRVIRCSGTFVMKKR